jgi:hypothetical protein
LRARWSTTFAASLAIVWGCRAATPTPPPLRADERAFVELYVQIARIEARRADAPDSVSAELDRLRAHTDTTATNAVLARLTAEPERWETIWDAIAKRLHEVEENPNGIEGDAGPGSGRSNEPGSGNASQP